VASNTMELVPWLHKQLENENGDLLAELVKTFLNELMGAEADALCGAGDKERSPERVNSRNGYRAREFDTRVGTIELAIPKLREGSYYPEWLLQARRRAEKALVAVVAQCYVEGVSTRRVDDIVRAMGIDGISKSQVSALAKTLDAEVEKFRNRPLDAGPYTYVLVDALTQKVREDGRVVNVACALATGVNADGRREVLGVDVFTTEDGAGWTGLPPGPGRPGPVGGQAGRLRRPRRPQGGHRRRPARHQLATLVSALSTLAGSSRWSISGWREGLAGHSPPAGEGLGSVTFEVRRQTCPSRRWRALHWPLGVALRAP